ncbi:flagellar hook-associated protein FlgK [Halorhodospira halochloris]|uniref:flagellar hook-associated protein FlgK n=1 Tax=Halorhodospira halochloris TaxID=1052 RepID=UPI001EE7AAD4|nr:flagellar hook-associated protein FlgK [Halorhodospira halochloris]MCG5530009.1 flagellar hook-associated protein FlgK [Halorhodospira halochloris]
MADFLNTGITGLRASQRGLATTSHNISNVNTDGFSRQRVEQDTTHPHYYSRGAIGTGTQVQTIQRLSEDTRVEGLRRHNSEFERLDKLQEMTSRVDNLVADKDAGLSPAMREFFDAVEEVANDPSNTVTRQLLLTRGQALVDRFETMDNRLLELQNDVDKRIDQKSQQVNGLAHSIAELNNEIRQRFHNQQRPPNDLLDQRDEKIRQLSELVAVRVTQERDGSVNVGVGGGQPLVVGDRTYNLDVVQNPYDPERPELAMQIGDREVVVTDRLRGGSMGGLLEFREGVLDETRDDIGRVATSLGVALNEQHKRGVHYEEGEPQRGDNFFDVADVKVSAHAANVDAEKPEVQIDPERIGELQGGAYSLRYDAGNDQWQVRREQDNQTINLLPNQNASAAGNDVMVPDEDGYFRFDGMKVKLPDGAEDGERFLIEPTKEGARGLDTRLSRPTQIAAASPAATGEAVTAAGQSQNTGRGEIGPAEVGDAEGVMEALSEGGPLHKGVILEHQQEPNGESYFQVYVGGEEIPGARLRYNPDDHDRGQEYNLSNVEGLEDLDVTVRISGLPDPGDSFAINGNYEGVGDNTNALAMAELMDESIMDNGNSSFQEAYSSMVGDLGGFSQRVQTNRDAQQTLLRQAEEHWEELSGVNLDEEAANMMEYQQAYQAAAQVITTADEVFQEILNAVRR